MTIDWTKAIEAVHEDGRVAAVRVLNTDERNPAHGYKECEVMGEVIWYLMDGGANITYPWHIRNVKEEAVMETKSKVGDHVRHRFAVDAFRNGAVATVVEIENGNFDVVAELPSGIRGYGPYENWEIVAAANDELTALRAFRAMALERYPDLEPKPETDEEAAMRFSRDLEECEWYSDVLHEAFAWARANPRNTETKEG